MIIVIGVGKDEFDEPAVTDLIQFDGGSRLEIYVHYHVSKVTYKLGLHQDAKKFRHLMSGVKILTMHIGELIDIKLDDQTLQEYLTDLAMGAAFQVGIVTHHNKDQAWIDVQFDGDANEFRCFLEFDREVDDGLRA